MPFGNLRRPSRSVLAVCPTQEYVRPLEVDVKSGVQVVETNPIHGRRAFGEALVCAPSSLILGLVVKKFRSEWRFAALQFAVRNIVVLPV